MTSSPSLVSPLGVVIGIGVTSQMEQVGERSQERACVVTPLQASGGHLLAIGVLQGLAAGTLLYITFYEVRQLR